MNLVSAIPVSYLLIYAPKFASIIGIRKLAGKYDNEAPREQQAILTGWPKRAINAHYNGMEAFAPFAIAVVLLQVRGIHGWSERLACLHLGARVVYIGLYIGNLATPRSLVWTAGFLATLAMMTLGAIG